MSAVTKKPLAKARKPLRASSPVTREKPLPPKPKKLSAVASEAAPAFNLTDILAQSSWQVADEALARALRDFSSLERIAQSLGRKLRGGPDAVHAERMEGALLTVTQSLRNAGRRRSMQRFGVQGGVEDYDERLHALDNPSRKAPAKVRILAQGVARGAGPEAEIILKAQVSAVRQRVARTRKAP